MTITQLADRLIASYARVGGINHLGGSDLPSKSAVAQITEQLLRLLYPGFFDEESVHIDEIKASTAFLMDSTQGHLEDEIYKSLKSHPKADFSPSDLRGTAREVAMEVLAELPAIRELLQTDAEAAYNGDPAALCKEEVILAYPFMEAIAVQRLAHQLYRRQIPLIPRMMTEWAHARSGMDLHPGAKIGSHFFVDHCTGTVVGETCIIGHHVKMYHGVTLGARSTGQVEQLRGVKRHPTIEDHVTIYPGATILGGETVIGAGSTIGGNVFLIQSVAPNSLVVMEDVKVKVLDKSSRRAMRPDFQI